MGRAQKKDHRWERVEHDLGGKKVFVLIAVVRSYFREAFYKDAEGKGRYRWWLVTKYGDFDESAEKRWPNPRYIPQKYQKPIVESYKEFEDGSKRSNKRTVNWRNEKKPNVDEETDYLKVIR